jgi:hypothetical protein
MALLRYIYVFVLAFFLGAWGTSVCDGAVKQAEEVQTARYEHVNHYDRIPFERILQTPLSNGSELERDQQRNISRDAREQESTNTLSGNIPAYAFHPRVYTLLHSFVATQPLRFISFATLLVFPKHWFW